MRQMEADWIIEQVKSIRNLCDIAELIARQGYFKESNHINTVLELLLCEVQDVVDKVCVVRDDKNRGS